MRMTGRVITETYKYKDIQERDAHAKEMVENGWNISLYGFGQKKEFDPKQTLVRYSRTEKS